MLAALLSARAVPGAASLATVPRGTQHKGGSGDLRGAVSGALAHSYRRAHCPAPCAGSCAAGDLPWARHRAPAAGHPPQGHKAYPEPGVYGEQALFQIHVSHPPANPYRHWNACGTQETARETIAEAQPPLTPPRAKGLSTGPCAPAGTKHPWGLTYLRLLDDPPICRISNAVREHNTLHNFHKHMQYIKCYAKSTFAGSPHSCQTARVGAEPALAASTPGSTGALGGPWQAAAQETHCTGCAAKSPYWQRLPYALFVFKFATVLLFDFRSKFRYGNMLYALHEKYVFH